MSRAKAKTAGGKTPEELELEQLQLQYRQVLMLRQAKVARDSLIDFTMMSMPHPEDPDDVTRSRYSPATHHHLIARALEKVESGEWARLIITMPPRHGKTELATKRFPAWFVGRDPYRYVIAATYADDFAQEIGAEVRDVVRAPFYQRVFPGVELKPGAQSMDRLQTTSGGILAFVGRKGRLTGRGGDLLLVDDPIKDREEADSPTIRNKTWHWFTDTLMSRQMTDAARVVVIMCMAGDTPVRMADGSQRALRDIRPRDRIATFEGGELSTSVVERWASQGVDDVFEIRSESGGSVKANARHPFLVLRDGGLQWARVKELRVGDKLVRLDGERTRASTASSQGAESPQSASSGAHRITTSGDGRAASALRRRCVGSRAMLLASSIATASRRRITSVASRIRAACARFANSPLGRTSVRIGVGSCASTTTTKQGRFEDSCATIATSRLGTERIRRLSKLQLITSGFTLERIESITPAGREEVFDIQVARTENFIANGFVSHNTRWHEDDIVGRLTDPDNHFYNAEEAAKWKILKLPALAEENDPLGRKPGEALWPERISVQFLEGQRRLNPRGFEALYQGNPAPDDGDFFRAEWIDSNTYKPAELPRHLRYYVASDHAVSTAQERDATVMLVCGVDKDGVIWLVDCWWRREQTDEVVDGMLELGARWKPIKWWAERGHISKSIGPFLRKRMREEKVFFSIEEVVPVADKQTRAQSIQGRMSMGMVKFPAHAPWFARARQELIKFPAAKHDDFVDALAHLGRGLDRVVGGGNDARRPTDDTMPKPGTLAWVKQSASEALRRQRVINRGM